jgi:hypothetical protein
MDSFAEPKHDKSPGTGSSDAIEIFFSQSFHNLPKSSFHIKSLLFLFALPIVAGRGFAWALAGKPRPWVKRQSERLCQQKSLLPFEGRGLR